MDNTQKAKEEQQKIVNDFAEAFRALVKEVFDGKDDYGTLIYKRYYNEETFNEISLIYYE